MSDAEALGLPPEAFAKHDGGADLDFYAPPRLVTHIDEAAVEALTRHYASRLKSGDRVLDLMSSWARFDPRCQCGAGAAKAFGPALIVPIEEDAGVVAIHRTFLTPDGRWKADMDEPKRMLGNPGVGAVRWGGIPLDGVLRLAEGVEDAASVMNLLGPHHAVWPVLGIERYQAVAVPESIHTVIIYSQHGAEAARAIERASPHLAANGRQLIVKLPPHAGDWNDLLREIRSL